MRPAFLLALMFSLPAHADLFRWVDPQSGSVKFSSTPPDWYGDPLREGVAPRVEVLRYQGSAPAKPPPATSSPALMEERWRSMLQFIATLPQRADFDRASPGLQQQLQAVQAARAELDRLDPGGAPRRRLEEAGAVERLKQGLEARGQR